MSKTVEKVQVKRAANLPKSVGVAGKKSKLAEPCNTIEHKDAPATVNKVNAADTPEKGDSGHGEKKQNAHSVTPRELMENSINEFIEVRNNIIFDQIEYRKKGEVSNWEAANEDEILRILELNGVTKCPVKRISSILKSSFTPKYNPFKSYFDSLPKWDGIDYIGNLSKMVILKNETRDRKRFETQFLKAVVRTLAASLSESIENVTPNKQCLVLVSPLQNIGKTHFIRYLTPPELKLYGDGEMSFGDRDEKYTMKASFIINLDELSKIEENNMQIVKSALSTAIINVRRLSVGSRIIEPRRCSFWGSTNVVNYLKKDTGTSRWLSFEIDGFTYGFWLKSSKNFIDINNVWSQALKLFKDGFKFELTAQELQENELANTNHKSEDLAKDLVLSHFKIASKEKGKHRTSISIYHYLMERHPYLKGEVNSKSIGAVLRANFSYDQEYNNVKKYNEWGYYVEEII